MTANELKHKDNVERALATCRSRLKEKPNHLPFQIAEEQLSYLLTCLSGKEFNAKELSEINVGLLAVREFEPHDMELANQIYEALEAKKYLAQNNQDET
ncbi:MAG: hypothetical protein K2Y31_16340 [Burkholderiales bacterium]|jgi:hypothetical protein|nr:hypothetical protein [Burkholderiales bacterium]